MAVQPRGYGEHDVHWGMGATIGGSAPWIRGTLEITGFYLLACRFSPVDTGNTPES